MCFRHGQFLRLRSLALANARREFVLEAARAAFCELGMEKTGIRKIARRAGDMPGATCSHLASKEEFYAAPARGLTSDLNEALNGRLRDALQAWGMSSFEQLVRRDEATSRGWQ